MQKHTYHNRMATRQIQTSMYQMTPNDFDRIVYCDSNIYGLALNVRNNAPTGALLAHLTYDALGRRSLLTFNASAVNEYRYGTNGKRIDQISEWIVTPNNASPITRLFDYDNNGYLTGTGEWSIQNDNSGRIQQAIGHGVKTIHEHDDFGNNIKHQAGKAVSYRNVRKPAIHLCHCDSRRA